MKNKVLIALAGESGCGKDTASNYLAGKFGFMTGKFSERMKSGLRLMLGLTIEHTDGALKNVIHPKYGKTPVQMLQTLGTEWGQDLVCEDVWIQGMITAWNNVKAMNRETGLVISDLRFDFQADWVRKQGGAVVHISNCKVKSPLPPKFLHKSDRPVTVRVDDFHAFNNKVISSGMGDFEKRLSEIILSDIDRRQEYDDAPCHELTSIESLQNLITTWADSVFPNRTIENALKKLVMEEIPEYLMSQHDPMELADCAILIYDVAHLAGIDLEKAMRDKMEINKKRTWEFNKETGLMKHVKEVGAPSSTGNETQTLYAHMKGDES